MISPSQKVKMLLAYKGISEAHLARLLNTTPSAFNQRMKNNTLSVQDLYKIADVLEVEFLYKFKDGEIEI